MGIDMKVEGAINFNLKKYEIREYGLNYLVENSKYAKGSKNTIELTVVGDISRMLEKSKSVLELIREWSKQEYKDPSYYNSVSIKHIYIEETIREITFPNAFIKEYEESINPNTGHGTFKLVFLQKYDKKEDIEILPEADF